MRRRTLLKLLAGGGAAAWLTRSSWLAAEPVADEFFIVIHAAGGWDVTLWADPRNERRGLVEPASTANTDVGGLTHWKSVRLDGDIATFEPLAPSDVSLRFGPGIGALYDLRDRLTILNGITIDTVSHEDGTAYAATGRHRSGGTIPESSIDVLLANELGTRQLMPDVSVRFPSSFVGDRLDRRAIPLRVGSVEAITKSFVRSDAYLGSDDRVAISHLLEDEAHRLASESTAPETFEQLASQQATLPKLLTGELVTAFSAKQLQTSYPQFDYASRSQGKNVLSAAFAVEAMRRDLVRCVSFGLGGLDTHGANYRQHAHTLQDLFGVIATLVAALDKTPHPTRANTKLSERTHILVVSEFCRTPQINIGGGRDHYPNNSALVISPRFKGGKSIGATDLEQLLPAQPYAFGSTTRSITPPDVLATFLGAFAIDPRRYMRDGEVIRDLLV